MLGRHSRVWLGARGWERLRADHAGQPETTRDALARWQTAGWPLVMRRSTPDMTPSEAGVALTLPAPHADAASASFTVSTTSITSITSTASSASKGSSLRIAAIVDRNDIVRNEPPLPLDAVLSCAPPAWRASLLALLMDSAEARVPLRVYGSLAWQAITGMPYLRADSDIDLWFAPADRGALGRGVGLLHRHAAGLPLDGEIIFPGGVGVAWKEWRDAQQVVAPAVPARVLAKCPDRVALVACSALMAELGEVGVSELGEFGEPADRGQPS